MIFDLIFAAIVGIVEKDVAAFSLLILLSLAGADRARPRRSGLLRITFIAVLTLPILGLVARRRSDCG